MAGLITHIVPLDGKCSNDLLLLFIPLACFASRITQYPVIEP
jgi:hypothetical protein